MIPRLAHWIWLYEDMPEWAEENICQFRQLHPNWTIQVWRDIPDNFPGDLRDLISRLPYYCSRSDIFRYWLLAEYGGVYLDTDNVALRSFEPLLRHVFFLAPCQPKPHTQPHLACGLMGSTPRSAAALRILAACRQRTAAPEPHGRKTYGPDLLTPLLAHHSDGVTILPLHYFYAIPDRETTHLFWRSDAQARGEIMDRFQPQFTDDQAPFAVHLWGVDGSSLRQIADPQAHPTAS